MIWRVQFFFLIYCLWLCETNLVCTLTKVINPNEIKSNCRPKRIYSSIIQNNTLVEIAFVLINFSGLSTRPTLELCSKIKSLEIFENHSGAYNFRISMPIADWATTKTTTTNKYFWYEIFWFESAWSALAYKYCIQNIKRMHWITHALFTFHWVYTVSLVFNENCSLCDLHFLYYYTNDNNRF